MLTSIPLLADLAPLDDTRCVFEHAVLSKLGNVVFRLAETDRAPVLVTPMGATIAVLPLRSLQLQLGIGADSADGRMLAQVARALDFIEELRPGDALPMEILCGEASWHPDPMHRDIACARVTLQLTTLFDDAAPGERAAIAWTSAASRLALAAASAPGMALRVKISTIELAATLGLPDSAAATQLLQEVMHEMSFIEALRVRLLDRVARLFERWETLVQYLASNLSGLELINRVRRLADIGLRRIRARFKDLEQQTADLLATLRDLPARRAVIRLHRDWLYCSLRAWEGVLSAWETASPTWSDDTWPLLSRTYRFLAPRFMPTQEWLLSTRARQPEEGLRNRMVW